VKESHMPTKTSSLEYYVSQEINLICVWTTILLVNLSASIVFLVPTNSCSSQPWHVLLYDRITFLLTITLLYDLSSEEGYLWYKSQDPWSLSFLPQTHLYPSVMSWWWHQFILLNLRLCYECSWLSQTPPLCEFKKKKSSPPL
jgi:hypothetical protein